MGLYSRYVLPRAINVVCRGRVNTVQRKRIVPRAEGRVLEVGFGSGLNIPFFDPSRVHSVVGLDPSEELVRMAERTVAESAIPIEVIKGSGEDIPLGTASVDTVLTTYTLCTIPDVARALGEMARVLRPGGRLIFCEHGIAPDPNVRRWQDRLNPYWGRIAGGCHLNRDIPNLLQQGGFRVDDLDARYLPGWRPGAFNYLGSATPIA